jgi:hypothetical protein
MDLMQKMELRIKDDYPDISETEVKERLRFATELIRLERLKGNIAQPKSNGFDRESNS